MLRLDARPECRLQARDGHQFMDEALASRAYEDTALPIAHGQTISQPYIVARMTEWLLADSAAEGFPESVLEIGAKNAAPTTPGTASPAPLPGMYSVASA